MKQKIFIVFYLFVITHVIPCYGAEDEFEGKNLLSLQNPSTLRRDSKEYPSPPQFGPRAKSFSGDYTPNAHHQATVNAKAITEFTESITAWYYQENSVASNGISTITAEPSHTIVLVETRKFSVLSSRKAIDIVDLGCGPGKPTHDLLHTLTQKNVFVKKITGYDISSEQIEQATDTYKDEPQLNFHVQDIEKITDRNRYDIVVSFFALHWANDINEMAKLIRDAIKPNGKLMFLIPLGDDLLFTYRQRFREESTWQSYLSDFPLVNFYTNEQAYKDAFDPHFTTDALYTKIIKRMFNYTGEEFTTFLSSWLPEKRYLQNEKGVDSSTYVRELVDFIMTNLCEQEKGDQDIPASIRLKGDKIVFTGRFFQYGGQASSLD